MEPPKLTDDQLYVALEEAFRRATHDQEFRSRCIENPGLVIREISGKELPDNVEVSFVDANETNSFDHELDLDQLDSIQGGIVASVALKRKICFTI